MDTDQANREENILTNGNHPDAVEKGFEWLQEEWQDPENRDTVIAVPSKRNLDNIQGTLKPLLGESGFKDLKSSDNYTNLGKGLHLHTMTKRIHPNKWDGGPVLALFVNDEQLEEIDELRGTTSILVVPWRREDVSNWEDRWSPDVVQFDPNKN